ncbi:GpE family phage tail protein [Citromicrobium bathyomarinum]
MTDLAAIFHWSLHDLQALEIEELIFWRERAIRWWNAANVPPKGNA